jgi:hypothetical protein
MVAQLVEQLLRKREDGVDVEIVRDRIKRYGIDGVGKPGAPKGKRYLPE